MAGNATIGALRVQLGLDTAQFETGLKKSQSQLAGFGKAAGIAGAAIAAAFVGVGIAAAASIKGAIDAADEMSIAAGKLGVGTEALSKLAYAAKLSDVSFEQLQGGLKKLSVNMAEAAGKGAGKAADAFRALGITVTETNGRLKGSDVVFAELAAKFGEMEGGAEKAALAVALFGKSGTDLLPLLNAGREGLAGMVAEAEALGIVISERTGKAAEEFNDNLDRLRVAAGGVSVQLAAGMLPALESVSGALVGTAKNAAAMDAVAKVLGGTVRVLATAVVGAAGGIAYLGTILGGVLKALNTPVSRAGDALKALDEAGAKATTIARGTGQAISDIWTEAARMTSAKAPAQGEAIAAPIIQGAEKAKKAAKDIETEAERVAKALKALQDDLAREQKAFGEKGLSQEDIKFRELLGKAGEALKLGNEALADSFIALATAASLTDDELVKIDKATDDLVSGLANAGPVAIDKFEQLKRQVEDTNDAFNQAADAADELFYGIANRDWASAFRGLLRAIEQVKLAFDKAATSADKVNAVAAVGNAVGQAVGGKAGGAISGAASGAATGFAVGGPIGAGIGAVVGGIAGFLGASKAKKQAKREEAARKAQEEANRLAAIANQRRELEIALLEAQGKSAEALAERRKDELAAMDETNRSLAQQLYDLADAADARAKAEAEAAEAADRAATLLATKRELEIQLMEAQGNAVGALAARRQDELTAMDDSLDGLLAARFAAEDLAAAQEAAAEAAEVAADAARVAADKAITQREFEIRVMEALGDSAGALAARRALELDALDDTFDGMQQIIWAAEDFAEASKRAQAAAEEIKEDAAGRVADARNALSEAYEREADALRSTISRFREFAENLRSFRESLSGGGGAAVASEFKRVASLARLGNEEALGNLPGAGQRFLESEKGSARTLTDYLRSVGVVRAAVQDAENVANRQVSIAEQQLAANEAAAAAARGTEINTLSISEGVAALNAALTAQAALQTASIQQMAAYAEANQAVDPTAAILELSAKFDAAIIATQTTANVLQRVTRDGEALLTEAA